MKEESPPGDNATQKQFDMNILHNDKIKEKGIPSLFRKEIN